MFCRVDSRSSPTPMRRGQLSAVIVQLMSKGPVKQVEAVVGVKKMPSPSLCSSVIRENPNAKKYIYGITTSEYNTLR